MLHLQLIRSLCLKTACFPDLQLIRFQRLIPMCFLFLTIVHEHSPDPYEIHLDPEQPLDGFLSHHYPQLKELS